MARDLADFLKSSSAAKKKKTVVTIRKKKNRKNSPPTAPPPTPAKRARGKRVIRVPKKLTYTHLMFSEKTEASSNRKKGREVCRSDLTKMKNIEASCSMDLRMKMALNTLKEVAGASGDCVLKLPCHSGGQHMTVHLGKLPGYSLSPMPTFTIDECIRMKIQADLTDRQLYVILKNIRSECLVKVFI